MNSQTLTDQELEAAYLARYDLGPGYPQLEVRPYVKRLYLDDTIEEISIRFPPSWTPEQQQQLDEDLASSVRNFLSFSPDKRDFVHTTFSGSIALDRALAAIDVIARSEGKKRLHVVTSTPCIDIMKLFLAERSNVRAHFIRSNANGDFGKIDVQNFIEMIEKISNKSPKDKCCLLISSPENPTGATWSEKDFNLLVDACLSFDVALIVDHCFAVAGVHHQNDVHRIWDIDNEALQLIAIWDTGKTFGLNEDKLGFLICKSDQVNEAIKSSVSVLQFGVPRRAKLFFSELFRKASYYNHIADLQSICQENFKTLSEFSSSRFTVRAMEAGSLALVDISGTGQTDEEIRATLLSEGVGVIAGNVFFHTKWVNRSYIRIALARNPDYYREAITHLAEHLP